MAPQAKFRGKLYFLSNMSSAKITVGKYKFGSSEVLFQVCKSPDPELLKEASLHNWSGFDAKKYFKRHRIDVRSDWHDIKLSVMWGIIRLKFNQNPDLAEQLLGVDDVDLVEFNSWNDTYWGVNIYTDEGENYQGRLLKACKYRLQKMDLPEDCEFVKELDDTVLTGILACLR